LASNDKLSPLEIPSIITSSKVEDTIALGKKLSCSLEKGSIIALQGPLGAGKTCLVKGIASGLGVKDEVTSPTYTIISEYEGILDDKAIPVYHIDAYRLRGTDDFISLGGEEVIFGNGISIIEWSERISELIPEEAFKVVIEIKGENDRLITIYRGDRI